MIAEFRTHHPHIFLQQFISRSIIEDEDLAGKLEMEINCKAGASQQEKICEETVNTPEGYRALGLFQENSTVERSDVSEQMREREDNKSNSAG